MWLTLLTERLRPVSQRAQTQRKRSILRMEALEHREAPSSVYGDPIAHWWMPSPLGQVSPDYGDLFAAVQASHEESGGLIPPGPGVHDEDPSVTLGGRGTVVQATALGIVGVTVVDTGFLPSSGGRIEVYLANVNVSLGLVGSLRAGVLYAETHGEGIWAGATAYATDLNLTVLGNRITTSVLWAQTMVDCWDDGGYVDAGSLVLDLAVNGVAVSVTGEPNQVIGLGIGWIVVNEQVAFVTPTSADSTVIALHVVVPGIADVALSTAHANCSLGH